VSRLRRLLGFLRPHLGWVVVAVAAALAVAVSMVFLVSLASPLVDQLKTQVAGAAARGSAPTVKVPSVPALPKVGIVKALDDLFREGRDALRALLPADIAAIFALMFLTLLVKNVFLYFGNYAFYRAGLATVKDIRDRLMDAMLGQSARFYQQQPSSVLMSRVTNDVDQITWAVSDRLSELFQDSFTLAGLVVLLFTLNLRLALVVFVGAPVVLWPIVHFSRKLRRRSYQTQERLGEMNTVADEVLKGWRVVQAFGMEPFEARRFREATRRHFRASLRARKLVALNAPVVEVIGAAGVLALLWYAHRQVTSGVMTVGGLSTFLVGLYTMYQPIKRLNKVNLALQSALASAQRVFEVIDEPVEILDRAGAVNLTGLRDGIRFEDVGFAYEPGKPVLREFNLTIPAGKAVALVGPSGAGKSTVAQLLPRFWDVGSGRITIDGIDVRDLRILSLRACLGLVTQETVLFNDTLRANIAYGRDNVDEDRLVACARAAYADEFIRAFPRGYDAEVGEAGLRLSGGQRQRIAVARALYKDPPLLILDEATSALDAEAEAVVQRALENLMRGRTSLVIAHRLATVRNADWIAVMDDGRVVEQGRHTDLLAKGGLYAHLAQLQGIRE
jgi:subfamily B ATP-binding cassette protein MsbA